MVRLSVRRPACRAKATAAVIRARIGKENGLSDELHSGKGGAVLGARISANPANGL